LLALFSPLLKIFTECVDNSIEDDYCCQRQKDKARKTEDKMSIISQVSKPKKRKPIITICGDAGMGKTSLAATFPKPIFVLAEDGMQSVSSEQSPDVFPLLKSASDMWEQLGALLNEVHDYQTVVIDSVTALERLFIQHVIDSDVKKPKSINQANGGYGAGLSAVATMHHRVRKACGLLNEKGMSIIFLAHAETETIELPDQDPYTRYTVRLGKKSIAPYVDDSDLVGYLRLETFIMQDESRQRSKAISNGARVLTTYATASNISKNRYGITQDIPVVQGVNPLINFIDTII